MLFELFLADLDASLADSGIYIKDCLDNLTFIVYIAYADDICIFAKDEETFRRILYAFEKYCNENGLNINVNNTKIMICQKGRAKAYNPFTLEEKEVEMVKNFKYWG